MSAPRCAVCSHPEVSHSTPGNDREYRKTATIRCTNADFTVVPAGPCQCRQYTPDGEAA